MPSDKPLPNRLTETPDMPRREWGACHQTALDRAMAQLHRTGIVAGALRQSEIAPDFALRAADGRTFNLSDELDRGPVVATFIRGGWCPFCVQALRALRDESGRIRRRGAQPVAISLETDAENRRLAHELGLTFPLLTDPRGRIAHLFGLLYRVPPDLAATFRERGIDLPKRQQIPHWTLPLAATYVIGSDGMVRYAFVEADPGERAGPAHILAALDRVGPT